MTGAAGGVTRAGGGAAERRGGQEEDMDADGGMDMAGDRAFVQRFTVATGYVATGLLAFTLLVGAANLLLRRRNPLQPPAS